MADLAKQESPTDVGAPESTRGGETYSPRVDILETQDELTLYADMPGVDVNGLDIRFEKGELTIHGQVAPRHEGVDSFHSEYGIGDFSRAFRVGPEIDSEKIAAELKDGVLTVHLPKSEAVKPKRIRVKTSD
jgi:HSP20 family molecular chaperone IbpA